MPNQHDAMKRARNTLQAIETMRSEAETIAHITANTREDEIVVVVIQADLSFGGVWMLTRDDMLRQIHIVEDAGSWSFTFSPKTSPTEVEKRCDEIVSVVHRRLDATQQLTKRDDT